MLYQPTRPPTVVAVTLGQLGRHYPTLQLTYGPAAAVLAGNIFAIGGKETSAFGSATMKEVHMYSPSTNSWIYISDLPVPISKTVVAGLSHQPRS